MIDNSHLPLTAILFDFDGTLLDTSIDLITACNALLKQHTKQTQSYQALRPYLEAGSRSLIYHTFELNEQDSQFDSLQYDFFKHYAHIIQTQPQATLYPGIRNLLEAITEHGMPWGVVTNKPERFAKPMMQLDLFPQTYITLICPENTHCVKPSPVPVLTACQYMNCNPHNTLFVGDHQRDITSGLKAGAMTCAALYGHIPQTCNPQTWHADLYIKTANDLLHWLEKNQWASK